MTMKWLFIGYTTIWVVLFAYSSYIHRQQMALEKEIALLKDVVRRSS